MMELQKLCEEEQVAWEMLEKAILANVAAEWRWRRAKTAVMIAKTIEEGKAATETEEKKEISGLASSQRSIDNAKKVDTMIQQVRDDWKRTDIIKQKIQKVYEKIISDKKDKGQEEIDDVL